MKRSERGYYKKTSVRMGSNIPKQGWNNEYKEGGRHANVLVLV